MSTAILYLFMFGNAFVSLALPWVGIILAYLIAVLAPHNIWWWVFEDVRPFYWVILPTLVGFMLAMVRGKVDFAPLRTRLNWCITVLWLSFTLSYYFGPYVDVVNEWRFYDPGVMYSTMQKTYLTYFVGTLLINDTRKVRWAALVMVVTTLYMTYWANAQYFLYHKFGRIHGPTTLSGQGIYADENNFAVLFVVGFPFVFYFGQYIKSNIVKWLTWLVIPFSWHAVFLTASRGALLGIGAVLLMFVWRSQKRAVGVLIVVAFVVAFAWQAGDVMKSRSATITSYESEDSASSRIEAWEASLGMMAAHPLTGVGFASFGQAFQDFSDKRPRVAHNTFFQIGGEWGILAGVTYLLLIFSTINRLRKNGVRLRPPPDATDEKLVQYYLNEACLLALIGFFVCSMFLSLQQYEVLYYLLLLANATLLCSGFQPQTSSPQGFRPGIDIARLRARAGGVASGEAAPPARSDGH